MVITSLLHVTTNYRVTSAVVEQHGNMAGQIKLKVNFSLKGINPSKLAYQLSVVTPDDQLGCHGNHVIKSNCWTKQCVDLCML